MSWGIFSQSKGVHISINREPLQLSVRNVSGSAILPSDLKSRNPPDCNEPTCQVCSVIYRTMDYVVRDVSSQEIITGKAPLPFTSRYAWFAIQAESSDLRRTHAHLLQGTRPSRKITNVQDIKRYLKVASMSYDGLVVMKRTEPFETTTECIVILREVLHGILTSLHIQLHHPSKHQPKLVDRRFFYAFDINKAIDDITSNCHQCAPLLKIPKTGEINPSVPSDILIHISFSTIIVTNRTHACYMPDTSTFSIL